LKPWRDGWRHLRLHAALFAALAVSGPGTPLSALGFNLRRPRFRWHDIKSANYFERGHAGVRVTERHRRISSVAFVFFTQGVAIREGFCPMTQACRACFRYFTLEKAWSLPGVFFCL